MEGFDASVSDDLSMSLSARLRRALPDSLQGEELGGLEFEREYAEAFARLAGVQLAPEDIKVKTGRWVVCDRGRWRYRDARSDRPVPLGLAYAWLISRRRDDRSPPELTRWTRRLVADAGLVDLPPFGTSLPTSAPGYARDTWLAIVSLARVRLLVGDRDPFPLAEAFISEWSASVRRGPLVTPGQVNHAKRWLAKGGFIIPAGMSGGARLWSVP